jgi:hypothetical protein
MRAAEPIPPHIPLAYIIRASAMEHPIAGRERANERRRAPRRKCVDGGRISTGVPQQSARRVSMPALRFLRNCMVFVRDWLSSSNVVLKNT